MVNDLVCFCNGRRLIGLHYDPTRFELDEVREDFIWFRLGKTYHIRFSFRLKENDCVILERRILGLTIRSQTFVIEVSVDACEAIEVDF